MLLAVASVLFGVNAWHMSRLVRSFDEFRIWAREKMEEHDKAIAVTAERHRIEDETRRAP